MALTTTTMVDEYVVVDESPSYEELSENANLQEAYNKLCKIATKDAMNANLALKKIDTLELEKKNLLVKLFDANELINVVKIKNMTSIEKVKGLEMELNIAREQLGRNSSSKLDNMLSVQNSSPNKTGLGYAESGSSSLLTHIKFFPPMYMPKPEVRVPKEEILATRRISVDLSDTKPKQPAHPIAKKQHKPQWFSHPNCFQLHASKQSTKTIVFVPKAQDPMTLNHELVKTLSLYDNFGVDHQYHMSKNSKFKHASKKIWMQKTHHK